MRKLQENVSTLPLHLIKNCLRTPPLLLSRGHRNEQSLTACMPKKPLSMSPIVAAAIFKEPSVPRSLKLFLLAARPSR